MWVGRTAMLTLFILSRNYRCGGLYLIFHRRCTVPGVMSSLYRKNLTPQDIASANPPAPGSDGGASTSTGPVGASVTILAGASTQGNPAYAPDTVTVKKGDAVGVINKDSVPHTITNGKDPSDPTSGKLFDTSIISPAASAQFATTKLAAKQLSIPLFHTSIHDRNAEVNKSESGSG